MNTLAELYRIPGIIRQRRIILVVVAGLFCCALAGAQSAVPAGEHPATEAQQTDYWSLVFVLVLSTFIGVGVIARVSRLLHTPLMSITNAISAIAVVGSIIVTGSDYPTDIRILGAIALFASMTNIVSGFLITDRMLKMFKPARQEAGGQEPKEVKP
jgi:H+-translocating NAD(P) transhydrogenase subunit alpha